MPVNGAVSILCKDFSAFEAFLFHNSPVLVDGDDFVEFFDSKDPIDNIWGGEYLSLVIKWKRILSLLRQCQLDPVFMFSAGVELRGQQFVYRLEGVRRRSKILQSLEDLQVATAISQFHAVNAQSVLVDLLSSDNRNHLRSPYCLKRSCAIAAALLECPLLASSAEYFLLSSPAPTRQHTGFALVPLQYINLQAQPARDKCPNSWPSARNQPCPSASMKQCAFLHAHRFVPESSSLNEVNEFYRPLMFPLLGSDALPRINLPKSIYSMMEDRSKGDYKTRRWYSLCSWLASFKPGSMEPVDRILATYSAEDRPMVLEKLADAVVTYAPDMDIGSRLACFLYDSVSLPARLCERVARISRERRTTDAKPPPNPPFGEQWKVFMRHLLSGNCTNVSAINPDFTKFWPTNLIKAFNQSALWADFMVPLYNATGVVFPVYVGNPRSNTSVYEASMALRLVHYRILVGLENMLGQSSKLVGCDPCVKEYALVGTQLTRYSIPVTPLSIDSLRDGTDSVLSKTLGLLITTDLANAGPLTNLAIALAIWHYQSEPSKCTTESPALIESPLALTVLACAVATWFNMQSSEELLCQHYQTVADMAEQQLCPNTAMLVAKPSQNNKYQLTPAYRLEYVHEYNAIQLVYSSFRSLITLLNELVPKSNTSILPDFTSTWIVFPSGRLVHWIAASLASQNASVRRHQTVRFWIPRLLCRSAFGDSSNSARRLRDMCQQFDKLLNIACSILPDRVPGLQVVHTKEPVTTVDVESFKPVMINRKTDNARLQSPAASFRIPMGVTNRLNESMNTGTFIPEARSLPKNMNLIGKQPLAKPATYSRNKFRPSGKRTTGYAARLQERLAQHEASCRDS